MSDVGMIQLIGKSLRSTAYVAGKASERKDHSNNSDLDALLFFAPKMPAI